MDRNLPSLEGIFSTCGESLGDHPYIIIFPCMWMVVEINGRKKSNKFLASPSAFMYELVL